MWRRKRKMMEREGREDSKGRRRKRGSKVVAQYSEETGQREGI